MADFKWYLNRQGVRGAKGDKGEKGFSPVITEKENTKDSYILHIQNETDDTSFDTPNLKEGLVPEDLGGTYVKLNRDTGKQYYGNIDEGTNTIKGIVRFATDVEASNGEEVTAAVTPDQVAASYTTKATTDKLSTDLTALTTQEQNDVIALGKRITTNETNISSMRADINSIASDSASLKNSNRFTGTNTFTGRVNIAGAPLEVDGVATLNQVTATYLNAVNITSSGEINAVSIKANGLHSDDIQTTENKKYLTEVDVDNQTIQVINGKLHANLDELGNEVNDLSGRVTANEADISTMKTSLGTKQTKLTAGSNITLTDLSDGTVRIDAAGGGGTTDSYTKSETDALLSKKNDNIFDIGNFTVTGSPTITDDGIASGFSSKNYINTGFILSDLYNKKWTIKTRTVYKYYNAQSYLGVALNIDGVPSHWAAKGNLGLENTTGNIAFKAQTIGGIEGDKITISKSVSNIKDSDIVDLELSFDLEKYTLKVVINNTKTIIRSWTPTTDDKNLLGTQTSNPIYIICRSSSGTAVESNSSIDLKQFSIIVDGKEVFNGLMSSTKPIYDAIKSNNTELSEFKAETSTDFSAVNSALNEKANLSDLGLKQNILISGTNIKTINGQSVLGEGDITVGGGTPTVIDGGDSLAN